MQFDSIFESGNLGRVFKAGKNEYDLFLNTDTNTRTHSHWFYFRVSNTKRDQVVKINIHNCTKNATLIKTGLSPAVFSEHDYQYSFSRWCYHTYDVTYTKNNIQRVTKVRRICLHSSIYNIYIYII